LSFEVGITGHVKNPSERVHQIFDQVSRAALFIQKLNLNRAGSKDLRRALKMGAWVAPAQRLELLLALRSCGLFGRARG
jgi:hypothetical protein